MTEIGSYWSGNRLEQSVSGHSANLTRPQRQLSRDHDNPQHQPGPSTSFFCYSPPSPPHNSTDHSSSGLHVIISHHTFSNERDSSRKSKRFGEITILPVKLPCSPTHASVSPASPVFRSQPSPCQVRNVELYSAGWNGSQFARTRLTIRTGASQMLPSRHADGTSPIVSQTEYFRRPRHQSSSRISNRFRKDRTSKSQDKSQP